MTTAALPFAGTYEIDPVHSTVQFAVDHIVSTFRASFAEIDGRLAGHEETTTLTASARVESVSITDPPSSANTSCTARTSFMAMPTRS